MAALQAPVRGRPALRRRPSAGRPARPDAPVAARGRPDVGHPADGRKVTFATTTPPDLARALDILRPKLTHMEIA